MPITLEIDVERNLVVRTVSAPVAFEDFADAIQEHLDHPDFRPGMHVLWDIRDVESRPWTSQMAKQMADYAGSLSEKRGVGRFAIIASSDLAYGLSRQYQVIGQDIAPEIGVFRTMEEALEWILAP